MLLHRGNPDRLTLALGMAAEESSERYMSKRLREGIQFALLLHDVSRLRRVVADRALKDLGTTWSQWSVLASLSRRDGLTQTALAAELELTKVAVGGLLNRMETMGLVERRTDEADARTRRVSLTHAGRRLLTKVYKQIEQFSPVIMHPVSDDDLAAAVRVLGQVKGTLVEMLEEHGGNRHRKATDGMGLESHADKPPRRLSAQHKRSP